MTLVLFLPVCRIEVEEWVPELFAYRRPENQAVRFMGRRGFPGCSGS